MSETIPETIPGAAPFLTARAWIQDTPRTTPLHCHAEGQLLGAWTGLHAVATATVLRVAPATHVLWLPPGHPHGLKSSGPLRGWSLYVAASACTTLPARVMCLRPSGVLREAVQRLVAEREAPWSPRRARLAAVVLDEIGAAQDETLGLSMPRDPRLLRIADALLRDPADRRDLRAWANWTGSSARTLSRRFAAETGLSFSAWRQRARLLAALERLGNGAAVTTVAFDVGYDTVSAFIAAFRMTFGETPARFAGRSDAPMHG